MNSDHKEAFPINKACCIQDIKIPRYLIILNIINVFVTLGLIIAIIVITLSKHGDQYGVACSTPGCIHAASNILKYIDQSTDPCDDFFQFACGTYLETTNIPEDKSIISPFEEFNDLLEEQLKKIIDAPLAETAPKSYKIMKHIYDLCMNTTAIEEEGVKTAKNYFKELGGWPLLDGTAWNVHAFDWKKIMYKSRKLGFRTSYFLSLSIEIDDKNSSRRVVKLDNAELGLDAVFLLKDLDEEYVKAYYSLMVDVAVLFGADRNAALSQSNQALKLEIELAKISLSKEERKNSTILYNPMTVKELQEQYSTIPWLEYINNILDIPDTRIIDDDVVIVVAPKYISDLELLLRKTPKRVLANYVMGKQAFSIIMLLTDEFRNRGYEFFKTIMGQKDISPRWEQCTSIASRSVLLASGAAYVRKYFKPESKEYAKEMVEDIQAQFIENLKKIGWMDKSTQESALEKASAMMAYVGYPDELLDDKKIEEILSTIDISSNSFMRTMQSVSLFYTNFHNNKYRLPVKPDWTAHSDTIDVNAEYSTSDNSIVLPAAILQGVFFGADKPHYMNYGAIGYIIGHEITHGFDDEGRQYDKDGNLRNWWSDSTEKAFTERKQCIIEQYGNYTVSQINRKLNGESTQSENIADNGGIKVAYLAYESWVERNGPEKKLPGLKYTPNQIFWISAANAWCSKERDGSLKQLLETGRHSPGEFRIIGPLSNSEYFAKDFNCPVGSKMNPIRKCQVW